MLNNAPLFSANGWTSISLQQHRSIEITLAIRDEKSRLKRGLGAKRHHICAKFSRKGDQMGTDG